MTRQMPQGPADKTAQAQALRAKLLASALRYASLGMYVHPLLVGGKEPRWGDWETRSTVDPDLIERTWGRAPYNVGVACGPSGLVVLDLDLPHAGEESSIPGVVDGAGMLAELAARAGEEIAPTLTVRTASGGRHLVYRAPAGVELRNTAKTLGWCIDTRAAGGYVVGIGSVVDGSPYILDGTVTVPALLPSWLQELMTAASVRSATSGSAPRPAETVARLQALVRQGNREQRWAAGILRSECDELAAMRTPGGRNQRLNLSAYRAGQLVGSGLLDQAEAEQQLTAAAESAGLGVDTPHEIEKTIASGMRAGLARPRWMSSAPARRMGGAA